MRSYNCNLCNTTCATRKRLEKHNKKFHHRDQFVICLCDAIMFPEAFDQHFATRHSIEAVKLTIDETTGRQRTQKEIEDFKKCYIRNYGTYYRFLRGIKTNSSLDNQSRMDVENELKDLEEAFKACI